MSTLLINVVSGISGVSDFIKGTSKNIFFKRLGTSCVIFKTLFTKLIFVFNYKLVIRQTFDSPRIIFTYLGFQSRVTSTVEKSVMNYRVMDFRT